MKQEILKLNKQGLSGKEIAERLKCSPSTVTYYCNEEYRVRHVKNHKSRRHKIKLEAIEYKGGKCEICSYDKCKEALEFHHRDPKEKDPNIKGALTRSSLKIEDLKPELDKCALLCCRCHREIHAGLIELFNN